MADLRGLGSTDISKVYDWVPRRFKKIYLGADVTLAGGDIERLQPHGRERPRGGHYVGRYLFPGAGHR